MHVNRQRVFIWIPLLVCTIIALAYLWLPSLTSVMADDDTPRAGEDIAEIYRRVSKSVVSIEVEIGRFDVASGTGFVVDEYGHIVTNAHVVEDAFAIAVEFQDGLQTSAELIGMDTLVDIAVIKVDVRSYRLKPVTFGDSDDLAVGQSVLAIGNPFGLEATLTTGIISGLKREVEFDDGSILDGMIQTDAAIAPGSSGGPLLTLYGEVIGVNSAGYGSPFGGTNFGFAIPSNLVKRISENMIVQHSEFGRIGIAVPGSTPNNERAIVATPIVSTPQSQFELPKATPTATETDQPTVTDTIEPTATDADPPSLPQQVEASTPTATSTLTEETVIRSVPTLTPLPTLNQTEVAELLATPPPRPTLPPTWTAVPTLPPTNTIVEPPPEAIAPLDISTPSTDNVFVATPFVSTPQSELEAPTITPTPTATLVQPTVAVRTDLLRPVIQPPISQPTTFSISGASVYQYNVGLGQVFSIGNIQLQGGVRLFLQNPVDANSFLRTDYKGILRYKPIGVAQEGEMSYSPYFEGYSGGIVSIDQNKNRIVELDWSADGRQFSYRIDTPLGLDNSNAGVWFWQPNLVTRYDPTYQVIRDCPVPGYNPCNFVYPSNARHWRTIGVQWSPVRGDNNILLTVQLPEEGRNALAIVQAVREPLYSEDAPQFTRYDYGTWNPGGQGITVSGRRPDHRVVIAVVNNNLSGEQVVLDGSARGLWLRDAVRLPNGQYRALGRPGGPGSGPVALYDQNGNRLSGFIGSGPPEDVRWFPDRSAVVVAVEARQYTVPADGGSITDPTDLTSNPQFSAGAVGAAAIPDAVVVNTEYFPGEQLRITVPYLNVRQEPTTTSAAIDGLLFGDYVAIFAGPHNNEGYRWWQVQTADNTFGWINGAIGGVPTVQRP